MVLPTCHMPTPIRGWPPHSFVRPRSRTAALKPSHETTETPDERHIRHQLGQVFPNALVRLGGGAVKEEAMGQAEL